MAQFEIFVNNRRFTTDAVQLKGNQIKSLAGVPADYELFLVHGKDSEPIGPDQVVTIKNGDHFRAIPPGTLGNLDSTPTCD
jgi:hypothetical protein